MALTVIKRLVSGSVPLRDLISFMATVGVDADVQIGEKSVMVGAEIDLNSFVTITNGFIVDYVKKNDGVDVVAGTLIWNREGGEISFQAEVQGIGKVAQDALDEAHYEGYNEGFAAGVASVKQPA